MSRQKEADEIIKDVSKMPCDTSDHAGIKADSQIYVDKYLKPQNPLFEEYKKFASVMKCSITPDFIKFKEIFKEELNGTRGLDEAIKYYERQENHFTTSYSFVINKLKEIKEKLEL